MAPKWKNLGGDWVYRTFLVASFERYVHFTSSLLLHLSPTTSTGDFDYLGSNPALGHWLLLGTSRRLGELRQCGSGNNVMIWTFCFLNSLWLRFHLPALASRLLPSVTWNSYVGSSSRNFEERSLRRVKFGYGFYYVNCFETYCNPPAEIGGWIGHIPARLGVCCRAGIARTLTGASIFVRCRIT